MRLGWIAACVFGEAVGIAAVAATYAALDRGVLDPAWAWILAAGAIEGVCLGGAQAMVLKTIGVRPLPWIAMTALGAVIGYGLSILGGAGTDVDGSEPPALLLLGLGAALGVVMGALLGAAQWLSARGKVGLVRWIALNAIGWAPAMAVIMLAATSAQREWPLSGVALLGAGAGALAGLLVGAATSLALPRSRDRASEGAP